jgi:hypothetical protein
VAPSNMQVIQEVRRTREAAPWWRTFGILVLE